VYLGKILGIHCRGVRQGGVVSSCGVGGDVNFGVTGVL
jgi:hypothetical protein